MFAAIGGRGDKNLRCFFPVFLKSTPIYQVPSAPIKVARVPNTISKILLPITIFETRQPIVTPGTPAKLKNGRIVSASENLT